MFVAGSLLVRRKGDKERKAQRDAEKGLSLHQTVLNCKQDPVVTKQVG